MTSAFVLYTQSTNPVPIQETYGSLILNNRRVCCQFQGCATQTLLRYKGQALCRLHNPDSLEKKNNTVKRYMESERGISSHRRSSLDYYYRKKLEQQTQPST